MIYILLSHWEDTWWLLVLWCWVRALWGGSGLSGVPPRSVFSGVPPRSGLSGVPPGSTEEAVGQGVWGTSWIWRSGVLPGTGGLGYFLDLEVWGTS